MKGFVNLTHTNNKKIEDLQKEVETKQSSIPINNVPLINSQSGKINSEYLPEFSGAGGEVDLSNYVKKVNNDESQYYIDNSNDGIIIGNGAPLPPGTIAPSGYSDTGIVINETGITIDSGRKVLIQSIGGFHFDRTGSSLEFNVEGRPVLNVFERLVLGEEAFPEEGSPIATMFDIEQAIGNVSALMGDTEDLEV